MITLLLSVPGVLLSSVQVSTAAIEIRLGDVKISTVPPAHSFFPGDFVRMEFVYSNLGREPMWIGETEFCACSGPTDVSPLVRLDGGATVTRVVQLLADPRITRRTVECFVMQATGSVLRESIFIEIAVTGEYKTGMSLLSAGSNRSGIVFDVDSDSAPIEDIEVPLFSDLVESMEVLEAGARGLSFAYWTSPKCAELITANIGRLTSWIIPHRHGVPIQAIRNNPAQERVLGLPGTGIMRWSTEIQLPCIACIPDRIGYFSDQRLTTAWRRNSTGRCNVLIRMSAKSPRAILVMIVATVTCENSEHLGVVKVLELLPVAS